LNEKSHVTQERLYSGERKSIENYKRGGRTANKHGETEATEKSSKKFQDFFQLHRNRRGK
jgi:hypothetical protein